MTTASIAVEPGRDEALVRSPFARFVSRLVSPQGAVFLLLIVLLVTITVLNPNFADPGQFMRFLQRVAPVAIAAIGQYFVIVSGEFDLSMGSVVTATVVMAGTLIGPDESKSWPVLALILAAGVLIGLVNGLITTLLRVPSFIVTLGMMLALLGAVKYVTGGAATGNPADNFRQIGRGGITDVPLLSYIPWSVLVLAGVLLAAIWLSRRPFGRLAVAVGDSAEASRYAGTSIWWVKTRAFMISGFCAAVSGVLLVGYAGVHPSVGQGYEFTAITAVVLGGVVLGGGKGWVVAAAAGAFALEALFMVLNFADVPSTFRPTIQGIVIIVAVAYSALVFAGRRRRLRTEASSDAPASGEGSDGVPVATDSAPESRPHQGDQR